MMHTRLLKKLAAGLLLAGLLVTPSRAETVTYLHTDLLGSVVLETDQNRNVVARYEYEPCGLPRQAIADQPGYTGHVHDAGSGLVYMQQRYYDPEVGRFLSVDPMGVDTGTGGNFNRYWYGNNNPYTCVDPDGRAATATVYGAFQADVAVPEPTDAAWPKWVGWGVAIAAAAAIDYVVFNESGESAAPAEAGNTNPYDGPVDEPVIVVDGDGNAIPVGAGERITSSPNGEFQQVRDADGDPTGTRMDKGGHPGQSDPVAQGPHGHRPGVTNENGNPHLPLNEPKPRQ